MSTSQTFLLSGPIYVELKILAQAAVHVGFKYGLLNPPVVTKLGVLCVNSLHEGVTFHYNRSGQKF